MGVVQHVNDPAENHTPVIQHVAHVTITCSCVNTCCCVKMVAQPHDNGSGGTTTEGGAMVAKLRLKTETLNVYRRLAGLKTDAALAARMGVDPGNLSRILSGKQHPRAGFIARLCEVFEARIEELWEVVPGDEDEDGEQ